MTERFHQTLIIDRYGVGWHTMQNGRRICDTTFVDDSKKDTQIRKFHILILDMKLSF